MADDERENNLEQEPGIDLDDADPGFAREVVREPGGAELLCCVSCGACAAGCPVYGVSERYNPRRIIRMVLLGLRRQVLETEAIWLCSTCYTCQERCPQGVRITDLMTALRTMATRAGYYPKAYDQQRELLMAMGRLYEIGEFDNKKRIKSGLPPIQMTAEEIGRLRDIIQEEE
ncbi:4Fe-4S dicluster domain-containing protein [bacterium]|nr:4Fe-4S dicluster domain-containing protein [candidate division CSSED10-310 bacterium]